MELNKLPKTPKVGKSIFYCIYIDKFSIFHTRSCYLKYSWLFKKSPQNYSPATFSVRNFELDQFFVPSWEVNPHLEGSTPQIVYVLLVYEATYFTPSRVICSLNHIRWIMKKKRIRFYLTCNFCKIQDIEFFQKATYFTPRNLLSFVITNSLEKEVLGHLLTTEYEYIIFKLKSYR